MSVPVSKLAEALPLMADVALRPTFPAAELDRLRKERLTGLLQARDNAGGADPARVSAHRLRPDASLRHLGERLAGGDRGAHRRRPAGVLSRALSARQRHAAGRRRRHAGGGAADAREGVRIVEGRRHGAARRRSAERAATQARQVYIVDKPEAAQSQIRIGWVGVPRSTPDYAGARGAEHHPRRIVHVAAEPEPARGDTATPTARAPRSTCGCRPARSSPPPACRPTRPAKRCKEFFNELKRHRHAGAGRRAERRRRTTSRSASPASSRPPATWRASSKSSSSTTCRTTPSAKFVSARDERDRRGPAAAAARYIQPDKMAVVVVGDRKVIEGPIRALNLGPINFITIDELFR